MEITEIKVTFSIIGIKRKEKPAKTSGTPLTYVITKKRSKYFETFLGQSKRYVAVQTTLMVTQFNIGL